MIPEDVGHITEHKTTCLTLKLFFIFPRRAFYWSSANMVGRHFWKIDIFFLRDSLVNMMTWLYYTYNNIEFQTLKIFFSSSYDMWRAFPWGHLGIFTLRQFLLSLKLCSFFIKHLFGRSITSPSGTFRTIWRYGQVEKTPIYKTPMWCGHFLQRIICGRHFPKASHFYSLWCKTCFGIPRNFSSDVMKSNWDHGWIATITSWSLIPRCGHFFQNLNYGVGIFLYLIPVAHLFFYINKRTFCFFSNQIGRPIFHMCDLQNKSWHHE